MVAQHKPGPSQADIDWAALGFARALLVEILGVETDRITRDAMLVGDLGADSLDMLELQITMEEKGCDAPDELFSARTTVGHIADAFARAAIAKAEGQP